MRQFRREFQEWQNEANQLRRQLNEAGVPTGEFDRIMRDLRGLDTDQAFTDPRNLAALQQAMLDRQKQFEFNLHYVYHSTRLVAPLMAKQGGGAIVNISSIAGLRHLGNELAAYAASKAGLQHFSRVCAVRYAPQGVRVNTVIPGLMNTPLVAERLAKSQSGGDAAALIAKRNARTPTGKMGDAWDVAWAVVYLASDEAKFVTGAEIVVDGALTATIR